MSFLVIIKRPKLPVALSQNNLLKLSVLKAGLIISSWAL